MNLTQDTGNTGLKESDNAAEADVPAKDAQPGDALSTKENDGEASLSAGSLPLFGSCTVSGINGQVNDIAHHGFFSAFSRTLIRASSLTAGKRLVFIGLLLLAFSIIVRHF